jgi:regulation of enolase protein 1 (concanavalin A-like superfamily)
MTKTFEKSIRLKTGSLQHQQLVVSVDCDNNGEFGSYDDVTSNLIINGKVVADISSLLDKAGIFIEMVDSIDWKEQANMQA